MLNMKKYHFCLLQREQKWYSTVRVKRLELLTDEL